MTIRYFTLLVLTCTLTACVNLKPKADTTRTYLLGPVDVSPEGESSLYDIYIARPNLPAYLEGNHMQYRNEQGELKSLKGARWGESLQEGIARALSEWVLSDSGRQVSGFYPWPKTSDQATELRLQFHQFGATADGRIQLSASWRIDGGADAKAKQARYYSAEGYTWKVGDVQSLVAGLNAALTALAQEISGAL